MVAIAVSASPFWLVVTVGLVIGLGPAFAALAIARSAFARLLGERRWPWALARATAAGSLGPFLVAPLGRACIARFGWLAPCDCRPRC